ncbi:MAG: tripartite tricarboxylate transporter substrate binding protein [Thermodesulfobacteriota bacterium]
MKEEKRQMRKSVSSQRVLFMLFLVMIFLSPALRAEGAENFPLNPIKLVITHAAGTSNDVEARTVAPSLQKYLGVPIVIENMPGTGGRKSREFVIKEKPTGYTLLSTGMPSCQIGEILFNGRYNTLSYTHIYSLFSDSTGLLVKSDAPYKDMADFVEKYKAKTLSCAVPGVGSTAHLNGMKLIRYLKLAAKWVPFDGGTEALTALAGGHVDFVICDTGSATAMLSAKIARLLMIFEDKRDPRYPDVPIQKDLKYDVDTIPSLRGVVGPPGVPANVVKILESAYDKAAHDKDFLALAAKAHVKIYPRNAQEFFNTSKSIWNEIKGQEQDLKSMMKSN